MADNYSKGDTCTHCHGKVQGHLCGEVVIYWCQTCGSNNPNTPPQANVNKTSPLKRLGLCVLTTKDLNKQSEFTIVVTVPDGVLHIHDFIHDAVTIGMEKLNPDEYK